MTAVNVLSWAAEGSVLLAALLIAHRKRAGFVVGCGRVRVYERVRVLEVGAVTERRITDPKTGGQKGEKLARFDLLPARQLVKIAEHYGRGAEKYAARNWEAGYRWSLSYGALQRHAHAFWAGEDNDPETGSPHLAAVVFHALALMEFTETHPELDDRPRRTT